MSKAKKPIFGTIKAPRKAKVAGATRVHLTPSNKKAKPLFGKLKKLKPNI